MALFDSNLFVVVHDTKAASDEARMGMLHIRDDEPPVYLTVEADWGKKKERPNDFESVCMLQGRPDELLAAESKYHEGGYGRIFHIQMRRGKLTWEARVKGMIPLPEDTDNLEGMQTIRLDDHRYILLLGERGGSDDKPQGEIRWGTIDLNQKTLSMNGRVSFDAPDWSPSEKNRDISELYIDDERGLWIAASDDPGNSGPFRSVIYRAGTVSGDPQNPIQLTEHRRCGNSTDSKSKRWARPSFR
ncbi:MAG: hypothetical protein KJ626_00785 [Verrucomicrobia bacterium]|nr:hypothetical protein [Verrucomicrobiota bacterium]